MGVHDKPFHSRIFRIYLAYLEKRLQWSPQQIQELLARLEMSRERLDDESSWFSAEFADRFYDEAVRMTGDRDLAYKAGKFIHESSTSPIMHRLMRGVMEPGFVYRLLTRFSGHFTKAARFSIVHVGKTTAHVESIPEEGFSERPYMCENRRGMLEGVPQVFNLEPAKIEESECLHRGGRKCSYHLKWERLSETNYVLRLILGVLLLTGTALLWSQWAALVIFSGAFLAAVSLFVLRTMQGQREELLQHNGALDEMLKELGRRNQQLQLIGQVAKLTHSLTSPGELSLTIVKTVCEQLGYDRCILLTTDFKKNILRVRAFHGFDSQLQEMISQAEFNLDAENTSGFFVRVVNTKEPMLIPNVLEQLTQLSPRSQKFAKVLGSRSFVAVPLISESREVLGVLSVDNITEGKALSISDQDLLMTLAQHLGIALHNAELVQQLEDSLTETRKLSSNEKILREVFQRFLPPAVASEVMASFQAGPSNKHLFQVRKRNVAVVFLDIADFTRLADNMASEDVVDMLNTAYSVWEPIIQRYGGFVDKFLGDGMLAIFDQPETGVENACRASLEMVSALSHINQSLLQKKYATIHCGIGINFGSANLGNIGSERRLNFTAIGEAVNMAFRLQSHTRQLGANTICMSQMVKDRLGVSAGKFVLSDRGSAQFKGYDSMIQVYELSSAASSGHHAMARVALNNTK